MPRYYFHIHDRRDLLDTDGVDLPDEATARVEAVRLAGGVLQEEARQIAGGETWDMEVTDAAGRTVYRLALDAGGDQSCDRSGR